MYLQSRTWPAPWSIIGFRRINRLNKGENCSFRLCFFVFRSNAARPEPLPSSTRCGRLSRLYLVFFVFFFRFVRWSGSNVSQWKLVVSRVRSRLIARENSRAYICTEQASLFVAENRRFLFRQSRTSRTEASVAKTSPARLVPRDRAFTLIRKLRKARAPPRGKFDFLRERATTFLRERATAPLRERATSLAYTNTFIFKL